MGSKSLLTSRNVTLGGIAVVVVAVLAGAFVGQAERGSCDEWQQGYLDLVGSARATAPASPPPDVEESRVRLEETRPSGCRTPAVPPPAAAATPSPPPEDAPLPATLPLVVTSKDPRLDIRGFRADLVDDETFGESYTMKVDLQWLAEAEPPQFLCDVRFLTADGTSMFQEDSTFAFSGTTYIDDWVFMIRVEELELYIEANGPPAAATISCEEYLL